jgi:hypothetical protein
MNVPGNTGGKVGNLLASKRSVACGSGSIPEIGLQPPATIGHDRPLASQNSRQQSGHSQIDLPLFET